MDWLTSLDVWLINTFQYPSIFMFVVALFIGTVAFPELWRLARRSYFEKPTANMLLLDAVSYIANKSAWGLRQPFMTSYVGAFGEARQNASKGDLMLWGLMENGGTEESPQFSTLEGPIEPQYWDLMTFHIENVLGGLNQRWPETVAENTNNQEAQRRVRYSRLRVNDRQVRLRWPQPNIALRVWARLVRRPAAWRQTDI